MDGAKAGRYANRPEVVILDFVPNMWYQSCELSAWVEHQDTQVVQTCWAVMGLMYAEYPHAEPIEKAVRLVMSRQRPVCCFLLSRTPGL